MSKFLHIHANAAHHRLNKIAEQTGLDLRKLDDVLQLVVATRLAQPIGDRPRVRGPSSARHPYANHRSAAPMAAGSAWMSRMRRLTVAAP